MSVINKMRSDKVQRPKQPTFLVALAMANV
jgi:hypothetical protein